MPIGAILADTSDYKDFWDACAYGKVDVVTKYVDANKEMAKISTKDGETCLHLTAISNSFDISKMMVDLGADVNQRVTHTEGLRMTPLAWHAYSGNHEIVELLLKNGADVNADFDAKKGDDEKHTVMDVADLILGGNAIEENTEDKFSLTYLEIKKRGGRKYSEL